MASYSLVYEVQRSKPELIRPAKPTPHEFKYLSNIDDQEGTRFQIPLIQFYKKDEKMEGKDPVKVIREAIAKALVYYYPFAGRLRERPDRKLVVECTGEGVLFIEASAYVTLDQFGDVLQPPFPGIDDLLHDVPGSSGILNCPLLLIQVTRLLCGGFIFALRMNHTMSDAAGLIQFLNAVAEMARGKLYPSIEPVWRRELLDGCDPPCVTCIHHEYDDVPDTKGTLLPRNDLKNQSFFFGPKEMMALRKHLPPHLRNCSNVELLTACLWKCRTTALCTDPSDVMRMILLVDSRRKFNPRLPVGYYGNAFALPVALSPAGKLCEEPLEYSLHLVKKAKAMLTEEYMKSVANLMAIRGRPNFAAVGAFIVSDNTRAGPMDVDYGWGKSVYGGIARADVGPVPGVLHFYTPMQNSKGEKGIIVPICLPGPVMERFVVQLDMMIRGPRISEIPCIKIVSNVVDRCEPFSKL